MKNSTRRAVYATAKSAKVGDAVKCAGCGGSFVKASYQQAFCKAQGGTVCKDKYWNTVTPDKRNNTTRISPASARWMERNASSRESDLDFDGSWEAHNA